MIRPTRPFLALGAAALAVVATGCTAGPATTVAAARAATPAASPSARATTSASTASSPTVVPASLTGRWTIHGVRVDIRTDGTGVMYVHDCSQALPACEVVSDLVVRPDVGGLRLTVRHTDAVGGDGRRVPLPASVDPSSTYQAVGDYSVLVPFTTTNWPYDVALTSALRSHVYNWQLVHRGGHPAATTDPSSRLVRDLAHFPAGVNQNDFVGA